MSQKLPQNLKVICVEFIYERKFEKRDYPSLFHFVDFVQVQAATYLNPIK